MFKIKSKIPEFLNSGITKILLSVILCSVVIFTILDLTFPVNLDPKTTTRVILASDGTPLRAFADKNGVWRYPVKLEEISPYYIEALLGYEDRWFYHHPGFNPVSLMRASFQWISNSRIVSGGSTLTMQVARLRRPLPRSIWGKLCQIFTAVQLEIHFNKDEILTYYINHAPFGGTFEGVQTACYSYFNHSAKYLTRAQAALLAVMPQAPSRFRPDRFPDEAEKARNKLLDRLSEFKIWSEKEVKDAKIEKVTGWPVEKRVTAPLLARRLHKKYPPAQNRITTYIKYNFQLAVEQIAKDYSQTLPPHLSIAIMVLNNENGGVEAYVGSSDFLNYQRFGHVDMVKALRSPGSTMKPFIYGIALDQGLIHSQSLLMDVPIQFGDYKPVNFQRSFNGPVSVSYALSQSLNLPAVQILDHLDPKFFYSKLINTGFRLKLPKSAKPNLSIALGGFATNLENLVYLYSSLGRKGELIKPKFVLSSNDETSKFLSEGSAWIIHDILRPEDNYKTYSENRFAIKTGTSYGFRDSWAIGSSRGYTIGIWVGRPDGLPVPGYYGAQTAVPLLKRVGQILPNHKYSIERPPTVTNAKICWPDSQLAEYDYHSKKYISKNTRNAWILNNTTPKTLSAKKDSLDPAVIELNLKLTKDGKYRIPLGCNYENETIKREVKLWPKMLESWLPAKMRREHLIPEILPECRNIKDIPVEESIFILGLEDGEKIMKRENSADYPSFTLKVQGGNGPWYWFVNSKLSETQNFLRFQPSLPGKYQIIVIDQSGIMDKIDVDVY